MDRTISPIGSILIMRRMTRAGLGRIAVGREQSMFVAFRLSAPFKTLHRRIAIEGAGLSAGCSVTQFEKFKIVARNRVHREKEVGEIAKPF